jgi:hypothetical protein
MSTLVTTAEVASQAMARDPRSEETAEAIVLMVQAIDEFLTTPPITTLRALETAAQAPILRMIAGGIRSTIERIRNMLSVAMQVEQYGGPVSWAPPLAEAISRLEAEFHDIPDLSRQSPPPIVRSTQEPIDQWRVEEPIAPHPAADTSAPGDESLDDVLEDAMDLVRAQHTEAMARVRGEQPLDWESVRRDLDDD